MKMKPLISVIIPVYNTEKHLERCLDSIVGQTYKNLQIILINDGSADKSGEICDRYAEKDDRIVCLHKENGGVSSARNEGLRLARGDYYHFPDSDDYLDADTYEYLLGLINEHNCDAVAFEHFVTYESCENAHSMKQDIYGLKTNVEAQINMMKGVHFCWNKFFKKELIEGLSFRQDIMRGEDTLFAAQALERADKVWFDKRPLYHYVQSEESACRGVFRPSQLTVLKLYDAYRPLYLEKHSAVWPYFLLFLQEVLISLYYDVWSDVNAKNYKQARREIVATIRKHSKTVKKSGLMSKKQKTKLAIFLFSPTAFCLMHKKIHKL